MFVCGSDVIRCHTSGNTTNALDLHEERAFAPSSFFNSVCLTCSALLSRFSSFRDFAIYYLLRCAKPTCICNTECG